MKKLFGNVVMTEKVYRDVFEVIKSIQHKFENIDRNLNSSPSVRGELYRSILFNKSEKFRPISMPDGTTRLVPDNQQLFLYRGQTQYYPQCTPALYRNNLSEIEIFIARLQTVEFEMVLRHHPAVQDIIKDGLYVHFPGLAQHYGIKTEFLDLTSDYWIAAFFAVCQYSESDKSYKPISTSNTKNGIMYEFLIPQFERDKLDIIGLQPFLRPGLQKAYSYELSKGERYHGHKMLFKHSKSASEKIYEMFEGGNRILPKDPIYTKRVEITTGDNFSSTAFQEVLIRYQYNKGKKYYLKELEHKKKNVVNGQPHNFSTKQTKLFKKQWYRENKKKLYQQIRPPRMTF